MAKTDELDGLKVAILIDDGFEQVEMTEPRRVVLLAPAIEAVLLLRPSALGPARALPLPGEVR